MEQIETKLIIKESDKSCKAVANEIKAEDRDIKELINETRNSTNKENSDDLRSR